MTYALRTQPVTHTQVYEPLVWAGLVVVVILGVLVAVIATWPKEKPAMSVQGGVLVVLLWLTGSAGVMYGVTYQDFLVLIVGAMLLLLSAYIVFGGKKENH